MKLIIRDDDTNFFTRPEDIEEAYSSLPDFPVSFAVVPMVTDVLGGCPDTRGNEIPRYIGDNSDLCAYLKERVRAETCDILLHGISHQYRFPNGVKTPEMLWREYDQTLDLAVEIGKYKQLLEELFALPLNCFVAPSNKIKRRGIRAVYKNGMNYSGIIPLSFDRDRSVRAVLNYMHRWAVRFTMRLAYPGILNYGTHLELNACNTITYDYLKKMAAYCDKINSPMAVNVHYWHMRDHKKHYRGFFDFVKYALDNGAEPARMRDCFSLNK